MSDRVKIDFLVGTLFGFGTGVAAFSLGLISLEVAFVTVLSLGAVTMWMSHSGGTSE